MTKEESLYIKKHAEMLLQGWSVAIANNSDLIRKRYSLNAGGVSNTVKDDIISSCFIKLAERFYVHPCIISDLSFRSSRWSYCNPSDDS